MKETVILYTTHCPMCKQLERQLGLKGIEFEECEDQDKMRELGLRYAPALQVNGGELMNFQDAIKWIKTHEQEAS